MTANNNVICASNNDNDDVKRHVTPVKVFQPPPSPLRQQQQQQQRASDVDVTVTSSSRCDEAAVAGLVELRTFGGNAPPIYYNQAHCVPLYGHYPRQYIEERSYYSLMSCIITSYLTSVIINIC